MDGLLINEQGIDATNRLALNASEMDAEEGKKMHIVGKKLQILEINAEIFGGMKKML